MADEPTGIHQPSSSLVTPDEATALLASWSPATRRLVARLVGIHFMLEDVPPLSFVPNLLPLVEPLLEGELAFAVSEREQHHYDPVCGVDPLWWTPVRLGVKAPEEVCPWRNIYPPIHRSFGRRRSGSPARAGSRMPVNCP